MDREGAPAYQREQSLCERAGIARNQRRECLLGDAVSSGFPRIPPRCFLGWLLAGGFLGSSLKSGLLFC